MDNTINSTIIEKVIIKSVAIYKAIDMLSQPPFEDKFKKETLCQQNENTQKQNSEKCLNEPEKRIEQLQNVDTNETKIVNEPENLNTTTQIKSGIYKIINKVDGKYYVGRSCNITKRWKTHKRDLLYNRHHNDYLQRAWNKYGEDNFEFIVVEYVENKASLLIDAEERYVQKFIEERKSGINNCYNMNENSYGGPSIPNNQFRKGIPHSIEDKQKISKGLLGNTNTKGKSISKSHREHIIANSPKGKDNPSFNHKIYNFYNKYTNEYFTGNLYELCKKEGITVNSVFHKVIKGERTHHKGWVFIPQSHSDLLL